MPQLENDIVDRGEKMRREKSNTSHIGCDLILCDFFADSVQPAVKGELQREEQSVCLQMATCRSIVTLA